MKPTRVQRHHLALLLAALLFGTIACAIEGTPRGKLEPVPPQAWQKARGPVVPHDTFPRDCSLCHEGSSWHQIKKDFQFDHEKETGVALEGAHAAAECLRCHNDRGPVAEFAQQGCSGCHEDIHFKKLGSNCTNCHEQTDWRPDPRIVSHARTRFPLVGSHAAAACFSCHPGADVGNFDRTPTECVDCHRDQIAQATQPDHVAQGFTSNCQRCHIPTTWTGAGFNHAAFFPLTGRHAVTACAQCHPNNMFAGTPTTCIGCHQADYNGARDPNHVSAGFSTNCAMCHSTSSWDGASFAHTVWPLTGSHVSVSCTACHTGGNFTSTPTACVACHQNDFNATRSPNHVMAGLPTTCEMCHNTSSWTRATFTHQGVTTGCIQCHQPELKSATNPNHIALNFPTACENCHNTRSWEGATFNHRGITTGCVQCHQADYNTTNNPNHVSAGFPTTCETCHTTATWTGATFNHTQFPINSGTHSHFTCQDCHDVPSNYSMFTCISCHTHNAQETNSHHTRVSGYTYTSAGCYNCHPNGHAN